MENKDYKERFEFLFYINDNIICQRYFNVNWYNYYTVSSLNLKEVKDEIIKEIIDHIKGETNDYMLRNYYHFEDDKNFDVSETDDNYRFTIKIDGEIVSDTIFSANYYPTKIRYSVDIRYLIPGIIRKLQVVLSSKNDTLEKNYLGRPLKVRY
jgi:hypothetical protein